MADRYKPHPGKDYMALLREEGFREIGGDENEDSGGALFGRESVYVSIAYSGEEMGVGITFDEGTEGIFTW